MANGHDLLDKLSKKTSRRVPRKYRIYAACAFFLAVWLLSMWLLRHTEVAAYEERLLELEGKGADEVLVLLWDAPSRHPGALKLMDLMDQISNGEKCQRGQKGCLDELLPNCPVQCKFSNERKRFAEADVVFFHPDTADNGTYAVQPPSKASRLQYYAFFGHEPVWKTPQLWLDPFWTSLCDVSVHWGSHADVQTTFYYFDEETEAKEWWVDDEVAKRWQAWFERTHAFQEGSSSALVSAVVSQCESEERESWLVQFMDLIPTASYGRCEHNVDFDALEEGQHLTKKERMAEKVDHISRHPFHLAIESTRKESGFLTEKIFQALAAGTIPIYFGHSATLKELVPPGSYIDSNDYATVVDLVTHVLDVARSPALYARYHEWRHEASTEGYFTRLADMGKYGTACRMCQWVYDKRKEDGEEMAEPWVEQEDDTYRGGYVYTKEDGWERVNSFDRFVDFQSRHPEMVADAFRSSGVCPPLYPAWEAEGKSLEEQYDTWAFRTTAARLVDMFDIKNIEEL